MRYAMILDLRKCFGCNACTVACKQANATPPETFFTRVVVGEEGTFPNTKQTYMPHICYHCDNAPCVEICPTGASQKIEKDGTVQIAYDICVGCRLCMEACPYDARFFNQGSLPKYWGEEGLNEYEAAREPEYVPDTVIKCTFCKSRRKNGREPACVETCPAVARIFGDLDDPSSEVSQMFNKFNPQPYRPEEGTQPRVFYIR